MQTNNREEVKNMPNIFEKGFNAFADMGNAMNKGVNKIIGKDVFGEIQKFEDPKVYPALESYPAYTIPEPEAWQRLDGKEKQFTLDGSVVRVAAELDTCMKYKSFFQQAAKYYTDRFTFRYHQCVKDYDTLLYYFQDMYMEGLNAMVNRACSIFLVFNVFNVNVQTFMSYQLDTYDRAIKSYSTMLGIQTKRNNEAGKIGETVGNSIQVQGGGFGIKGAAKGIAQAEVFNLGMNMLGKYFSHQLKLSAVEKTEIFSKFKEDVFFQEVYSDYVNTFYSLIQLLAENGILENISTRTGEEYNTLVGNIRNPLFPKDKIAPILSELISKFPFTVESYNVLKSIYGENEEVKAIMNYFFIK